MRLLWKPGGFERGGNTKTQGICRGEFTVTDGLPEPFRRGIYASRARSAPGCASRARPVRHARHRRRRLHEHQHQAARRAGSEADGRGEATLDMFGVSTPTFVTPDVKANAHLQLWSLKNAQIFHFLNLAGRTSLDLVMQGLWIKTQSSPFEAPYFSCVPYLLGEGQAMQYSSGRSRRSARASRGFRCAAGRLSAHAMVAALARVT
jgi:hypothetical protein